jgi:hypothetical protein
VKFCPHASQMHITQTGELAGHLHCPASISPIALP